MTTAHYIAMVAAFVLICAGGATGQTKDVIESETAPPKLVMLVYQRFPFDKATESGKALAGRSTCLCEPRGAEFMDCTGIGHRRFGSVVVRPVRFICTHRQSLR